MHLGNIFHVDFGFILGRDPKPFPAPMKITKEMVEAMGGFNSVHYQSFKSYCFTAYNILRKSANLILNLFGLMVDANIPDIKAEPDKAVWKVQRKNLLSSFLLGDYITGEAREARRGTEQWRASSSEP